MFITNCFLNVMLMKFASWKWFFCSSNWFTNHFNASQHKQLVCPPARPVAVHPSRYRHRRVLACKLPCRTAFHCVKWFIAQWDKSGSVNIIILKFFSVSNLNAWNPVPFPHTFYIYYPFNNVQFSINHFSQWICVWFMSKYECKASMNGLEQMVL